MLEKKFWGEYLILDVSMCLFFVKNKFSRVLKIILVIEVNIIIEFLEWNIYKNKYWISVWVYIEIGFGFV